MLMQLYCFAVMGEQHSDSNPGRTALMVFVVISSIGIIAAVFLILTERL